MAPDDLPPPGDRRPYPWLYVAITGVCSATGAAVVAVAVTGVLRLVVWLVAIILFSVAAGLAWPPRWWPHRGP
jgi:hypothetical protein